MGLGWHQGPSHCLSKAGEVVWDCKTQPAGTWHGNFAVEWREACFQPNPKQTFLGTSTEAGAFNYN